MTRQVQYRLQAASFLRQTSGSMTLESALVIPLFLFLLFTIVLIGIAMLNVNNTYYVQLTAVERAAFNWDKHERQFATGIRQPNKPYGVYEHDVMLTMLGRLFRLDASTPLAIVPLTKAENTISPGKLRVDKLEQAQHYLLSGSIQLSGQLHYTHERFLPRVTLISERNKLPLNLSYRSHVSAIIVDGPQHIRGVDLLIYYGNKIGTMRDEAEGWLNRAKAAIPSS